MMNLYEVTGTEARDRAIIAAPHPTSADELCPFYVSTIEQVGTVDTEPARVLLAVHTHAHGSDEELDVLDSEGLVE